MVFALLRGGAFNPRTSPYAFQGLKEEGLEYLKAAKQETGLPIVSEIMSADKIERFVEDVDLIQVGPGNMQNFELLRELGKTNKPVLLKRGLAKQLLKNGLCPLNILWLVVMIMLFCVKVAFVP